MTKLSQQSCGDHGQFIDRNYSQEILGGWNIVEKFSKETTSLKVKNSCGVNRYDKGWNRAVSSENISKSWVLGLWLCSGWSASWVLFIFCIRTHWPSQLSCGVSRLMQSTFDI